MLFKLALKSLLNRKSTVVLTIVSITVGIMLLISFSYVKNQIKSSFSKTVSGVDLIVGTRSSDVNLLLYSVFHLGSPTDNISWETYQALNDNQAIDWSIPISLGDSYRGYRVVGTNDDYFSHFKYGHEQSLKMTVGEWFNHPFEVVLGHEVAEKLKHQLGDLIILSHGVGQTSFKKHDHIKFKVSGVLEKTGTPVDQSLFVSLTGLEAVHINWPKVKSEQARLYRHIVANGLQPKSITAMFVALKSKASTFIVQRQINQNADEPLQAILPGVSLAKMWNLSRVFEQILWLVGVFVFVATLIGLVNMLMASLQSRKKELALLRIIGASPLYCFLLIQIESLFIVMTSIVLATLLCGLIILLSGDWLGRAFGLYVEVSEYFNFELLMILSMVLITLLLVICIPAFMYYRQSILKNINQ